MKLGIVYHMPFWRGADGTLREVEGSFARYVDSLAPYFDEISLCVPVLPEPRGEGTPIRATNVTLAPLPHFEGPVQFYPKLPIMVPRIARFVRDVDLVHCRVPTPPAVIAALCARLMRRPQFMLVVGDLRALLPTMPYRGVKRLLWRAYTAFEELNIQWMANHALTFANGEALTAKHSRVGHAVIRTQTTTIDADAIGSREDTCAGPSIRLLTVSRIDPRKGLRVLPDTAALLVAGGCDATVDVIGPLVGAPGEAERAAIVAQAEARGVTGRVSLLGPIALDQLLPRYPAYDVFVLPTLPGEGVPRVLLEAMAAGLPIVTSRVSGIPSLITDSANGLLVDAPSAQAIADAVLRIVNDAALRRRLIAGGYATARAHTLQTQAARMMQDVSLGLGLSLPRTSQVGGVTHVRKRVCFVLPSLHGGGAERAAVHILNALDPSAWDRSMYLFRREGAYLDAVDGAIALSSGDTRSRMDRWSALRRYFVATRPDLIVSFLSYLSVLSAASAARISARVVFNQQTPISAFLTDRDYHWRHPWHRRLFSWASRSGYRRADAVVATSAGVADDLAGAFGVARERIHVVHNPIDLDAITGAVREPVDAQHEAACQHPVIVAAGRLADAKNYPLLIEAVALLRARVPVRLLILGTGDLEAALVALVREKQLERFVTFAGFQRNPWKYIARADVFALSSRYEGFGNVLVEAMACGVPVVATRSPGTREIVTDGVDGLLVDRHEPAEFAAALARVLEEPGLRPRLAAEARRTATRFTLPVVAARYDGVFREVLA